MENFLEKLKSAIETGEENSSVANLINEIHEKAETKDFKPNSFKTDKNSVSEEIAKEKNVEFEKNLLEIKRNDLILKNIAELKNMENLLLIQFQDMKEFIEKLNLQYSKDDDSCKYLFSEIEKIKNGLSKFFE